MYVVAPPRDSSYAMNHQSFGVPGKKPFELVVDGSLRPGDILGAVRVNRFGKVIGEFQSNPRFTSQDPGWQAGPSGAGMGWLDSGDEAVSVAIDIQSPALLSTQPENVRAMNPAALQAYFNGQRRLFLSHGDPTGFKAYTDDGKAGPWLFRADQTPPDKVFQYGLKPAMTKLGRHAPTGDSLRAHQVTKGFGDDRGGLLSTSESVYSAALFVASKDQKDGFQQRMNEALAKGITPDDPRFKSYVENQDARKVLDASIKKPTFVNENVDIEAQLVKGAHLKDSGPGVVKDAYAVGLSQIYVMKTPRGRTYSQNANDRQHGFASKFAGEYEMSVDGAIPPEDIFGQLPVIVMAYKDDAGEWRYGAMTYRPFEVNPGLLARL
jgi:hypothetical protein